MASFADSLHDPVVFAIPVFAVFIASSSLSLRFLDDDGGRAAPVRAARHPHEPVMGFGSLVVNGAARVVALLGYAALYVLTPAAAGRAPLVHLGHRAARRRPGLVLLPPRVAPRAADVGRAPGAPQQPAVQPVHRRAAEVEPVVRAAVLGAAAAARHPAVADLHRVLGQPDLPVLRAHRARRPAAALVEFVFNTPSHHRVHHASDADYLDKNYGGILIVWDRLFGSYAEETHRPTYGLTTNIDSFNPFRLQYHEYGAIVRDVRRSGSWRERLGYLVGPPGWRPRPPSSRSRAWTRPVPRPESVEREVVAAAPVEHRRPLAVARRRVQVPGTLDAPSSPSSAAARRPRRCRPGRYGSSSPPISTVPSAPRRTASTSSGGG